MRDYEAVARAVDANARFHPVHIDGGVVVRRAGPGTATVHDYLRHLLAKGLENVPEPLGIEGGVETLRYLDGASGGQSWYHQHTDKGLVSAARLLRAIHDAANDWRPPAGTIWMQAPVEGDDVVYCHGDPGPWNFVWRDNEAVGLIDWDYLHPGPRLDDVAYALRWFAPLRANDHVLSWHHFPAIPDRRQRVRTFIDAYGDLPPFDVASTVIGRMQATSNLVLALAHHGVEPQRSWVADGFQARETEEMNWIEKHRDELTI